MSSSFELRKNGDHLLYTKIRTRSYVLKTPNPDYEADSLGIRLRESP